MMTRTSKEEDAIRDAASDWLVRMQSDALTAETWSALTRWLDASPENLQAYEAVERLDAEIMVSARAVLDNLSPASDNIVAFRPRLSAPRRADHRAALAAGLAAVAVTVGFAGWRASEGSLAVYSTGPGAPRAVILADGTRIGLDANSRLAVRLGWFSRRVKLENALASFDVAKDPGRPFIISADDERVRVVGTEFVVRDYGGVVDVTVRRGVVSVSPADGGGPKASLTPGWTLRHLVNSGRTDTHRVDPDAAFAWAKGRIVCDREPVSDVVAYLSHRYATPVRLASNAASRQTFSGVLDLAGDEDDVVRRLAAYVSLTAHRSGAEIVLD
jgi:transmembrane sensor